MTTLFSDLACPLFKDAECECVECVSWVIKDICDVRYFSDKSSTQGPRAAIDKLSTS